MKRIARIAFSAVFFTTLMATGLYSLSSSIRVEVLRSDDNLTTINYSIREFDKQAVEIDGTIYHQLRLSDEAFTHTKGEPELPYITRSIIIPDSRQTKINVSYKDYYEIEIGVIPSKGLLFRDTNPDDIPFTFADIYQQDEYYPQSIAELGDPYILRDFRGQTVTIYPFQYNPVSGLLRIYREITVDIVSGEENSFNIKERYFDGYQKEFESIYKNHFVNFNNTQYGYRNLPGRMIIIAYDAFIEAVLPYKYWKIQKGIPTTLHRISNIGNTAAMIKDFILQEYERDDGLVYVQLVGDHQQVPSFIINGGGSDPTFSLLDGDDDYPDIFVGRFSGETESQINTQIYRTVHYEKDVNATDTWLINGTGIASSEGSNPSDIEHLDSIRGRLLGYNYFHVDRLYAPNATSAQVTAVVNEGRSIINYAGHGTATRWSTTGFSNTNINLLTNDYKLPFIISVACVNGNFTTQTCFAEAWLRATNNTTGDPTGAINIYASSINQRWYPPLTAQSAVANYIVGDSLYAAGAILFKGSVRMIDLWGAYGVREFRNWNVFGDASLIIRNRIPTPITVNHQGRITIGDTYFNVHTNVARAKVSLITRDYELIASGYTNQQGNISLNVSNAPGELTTLNLTVTAPNRITNISDVQISPLPDHPYITIEPRRFYEVLATDAFAARNLQVVNRGEEELLFSIYQEDAEAQRSIAGTALFCSHHFFLPDSTYSWVLTVQNNSEDGEALSSIYVDIPEGVFVNSVTPFSGGSGGDMLPDNVFGEDMRITWEREDGQGAVNRGETAIALVNVTISDEFTGDIILPFRVSGDEEGEEPHTVNGNIFIYNELNNWLTVDPFSGELLPGDTLNVEILFESERVGFGNYRRNLIIRANDPLNRQTEIPVTMSVVDADQIHNVAVEPDTLRGSGYFNSNVIYHFTVYNRGEVPDNYEFIVSENRWNTTIWDNEQRRNERHPGSRPGQQVDETGVIQPDSSKDFMVQVRVPLGAADYDNSLITVASLNSLNCWAEISISTQSLGYDPDIPIPPVRYIAEFEPMQGILIRYPLGIPYALIRDFSEHTIVYTIVANQTTMNNAVANYIQNDVNINNCQFIIAPTNSFWVRDYAPWFVTTGEGDIAINDFTYNRDRRPLDNDIPSILAEYFERDDYLIPLIHTGGNMMTDGMGKAASTDLIITENYDLTTFRVQEYAQTFLGIDDYIILPDPTGDNLRHIDTWAKFLDVDKVMIRSVPETHAQYYQIEAAAAYFEDRLSSYGTPWRVYRVYTPNNEPYINSLMVNDRIYVPIVNSANNEAALQAYRDAMPGYQVVGFSGNWASNDAIHCRTNNIPDMEMLYIQHIPPHRLLSGIETIIEARINSYGHHTIYPDSIFVYWKTELEAEYNISRMYHREDDIYIASIDPQEYGQDVFYYIEAADESGRRERRPYIGSYNPFKIQINRHGAFGTPKNVNIRVEDGLIVISWEKVPYAASYIIEAANALDADFVDSTEEGTFNEYPGLIEWVTEITEFARFFRVIAVRD